jgi:hypothetical protein
MRKKIVLSIILCFICLCAVSCPVTAQESYHEKLLLYKWAIIIMLGIGLPILLLLLYTLLKTENEQRKILLLAGLNITILFLVLGVLSYLLWNEPDPTIAYVPVPLLEWAFIGGMVAVLYRLAFREERLTKQLYLYIVAKPVIGLVMGGLVFFIALGTSILLGVSSYQRLIVSPEINQTVRDQFIFFKGVNMWLPGYMIYWLCAIAFIGGFSDRFSIDLIDRFLTTYSGNDKKDVTRRNE